MITSRTSCIIVGGSGDGPPDTSCHTVGSTKATVLSVRSTMQVPPLGFGLVPESLPLQR